MKLCFKILAIAIVAAFAYSATGCAAPSSFTYQNVSVAISASCASACGAGVLPNPAQPSVLLVGNNSADCILLTATVKNAPANVTWTLYPQPNLTEPNPLPTNTNNPVVTESGSGVGTVAVPSGATNQFCPPSGAPVYTGAALLQANAMNIPQGDVLLVASVPSDPSNASATASVNQFFQIVGTSNAEGPPGVTLIPRTPTTPSTATTQSVVTVPHGTSYQFTGFAVGAAGCLGTTTYPCTTAAGATLPTGTPDDSVIWEVGTSASTTVGVIGGSTAEGTITQTGLYTAPSAVPTSQPVIILVSHALSTVTAYAYITVM